MQVECKEIQHATPAYEETVALRYEILRKPLGLNYTPQQLAAEDKDHHLAAYLEDRLAACLILTPDNNGVIKMRQVAVDGSLQGKGIGQQLVTYSEEWARAHKYKKMVLHARETAVPFYLKLGYKIEGQTFMEVGLPHKKMYKLIIT